MSQPATVEDLDFSKISIPPRPEALLKVSEQVKSKDPNLTLIGEAISSDVALAGAVLQVVNSPFYGLPRKLTSVTQGYSALIRFTSWWQPCPYERR
jgi:HD-like signal output (HDOD) protein